MTLRPAIVHLKDLAHRYMWDPRAIAPFVAATGLDIDPVPATHRFAPPRVLVALVPYDQPELLRRSRIWLGEAEHLVIVRDASQDGDAAELAPLVADEWREQLGALPHAEVVDWTSASEPAPCRAAIDRAVHHASTLVDVLETRPIVSDLELPASVWIAWTRPRRYSIASNVASQLRLRAGRAVLVTGDGCEIDLAAPPASISLHYEVETIRDYPAGMELDRARYDFPGFVTLGADPLHPIQWRGHRMAAFWMYAGAAGRCFLSASDHDYPCGPAKKLWGHDDNDPVAIALAPNGDACVQTFEHDVMITSTVPIGWHRAGAVDVAAFVRDPRRIVYYAQSDEFLERVTDDLLEEDNRELAPVVVLGPDAHVRYAVDLRHRVVRVTGHDDSLSAAIVGGPAEGYIVCDADHQIVRRGSGMLLGGWFRHATIQDDGWLWREDLVTGARTLLGSAQRIACVDRDVEMVVQDAIREGRHEAAAQLREVHETQPIEGEPTVIAIPGTRNVLEICDQYLRVL